MLQALRLIEVNIFKLYRNSLPLDIILQRKEIFLYITSLPDIIRKIESIFWLWRLNFLSVRHTKTYKKICNKVVSKNTYIQPVDIVHVKIEIYLFPSYLIPYTVCVLLSDFRLKNLISNVVCKLQKGKQFINITIVYLCANKIYIYRSFLKKDDIILLLNKHNLLLFLR